MMPAFALARASGAYLEVLENAPEHQDSIPVAGSNLAIGRDPNLAQIVLSDKSVSRLHARIMESGGAYRLYDEGSASGTYRNFERVGLTPQALGDNDDIHIGRVHLRFRLAAAAADSDSTQIMAAPPRPGARQDPVDDGLSTQPYMPNQPPAAPGRPPSPPRQAPQQQPPDDPDDISTQPYMPHTPKR
jgi:predicted component of type VI protein secretion system